MKTFYNNFNVEKRLLYLLIFKQLRWIISAAETHAKLYVKLLFQGFNSYESKDKNLDTNITSPDLLNGQVLFHSTWALKAP